MTDTQNNLEQQQKPTDQQQPNSAPSQADAPKDGGRISARQDVLNAFNELETRDAPKDTSGGDRSPKEPASEDGPKVAKDPATGKFIKPEDAAAQAAKPAADGKPAPIQPPVNWKGAAKVDWNRLPRDVQQALSDDYKARSETETKLGPLAQILGPRETALTAQYGGVPQAINQLFALSDFAAQRPQEFIHWFARSRGINLNQPVQQQPNAGQQFAPEAQNIDPALMPLVNRLAGIEQHLLGQQRAQQTAQQQDAFQVQQQAQSEVASFIGNAEKYPYANDVRGEMAMLFETGRAKTMDEAYEQAVYLNAPVRARVIQDQINADLEKRAALADQKKAVSVSVSGSPGGQVGLSPNRKATARDDVLAAARETGFFGNARL